MGKEFEIPIIWLDENILVINKPAGLLALPDGYDLTAAHVKSSLAPQFGPLWIVHRLDRYTSGVMIIARSAAAHRHLNTQFQERQVRKVYLALINGDPDWDSIRVDQPLSTNRGRRKRTVVDLQKGKPSATHFEVIQRFSRHTLIESVPETGRRHQIRTHLASLGYPVACDNLYGGGETLQYTDIMLNPPGEMISTDPLLDRPGLHARVLELELPTTEQRQEFEAPCPGDLQLTIDTLGDLSG